MKRKELLKALASVGVLTTLSYLTQADALPTPSITITKDSLVATADVIVVREGDKAKAIDNKTKKVLSSSPDHRSVINYAFTQGDNVVLLGDFEVTDYIIPQSGNRIFLFGSIKLTSDVAKILVYIDGVEDIEWYFGTLDGNKGAVADSSTSTPLVFVGYTADCKNIKLVGLKLLNSHRGGIIFRRCSNFEIASVYASGIDNLPAIMLNGQNTVVEDGHVHDIIIEDCSNVGISHYYCNRVNTERIICKNLGDDGVTINNATHINLDCIHCYACSIGLHVYAGKWFNIGKVVSLYSANEGIYFNDAQKGNANLLIAGYNTKDGVLIGGANGCYDLHIKEIIAFNNGQGGTGYAGVKIYKAQRSIFDVITAYDDQATKTQQYGIWEESTSDYNIIGKVNAWGNELANILSEGVHSYCDQRLYTSLPTDGFAVKNKAITYYDGTYYYQAVWTGSAWVKVQLA